MGRFATLGLVALLCAQRAETLSVVSVGRNPAALWRAQTSTYAPRLRPSQPLWSSLGDAGDVREAVAAGGAPWAPADSVPEAYLSEEPAPEERKAATKREKVLAQKLKEAKERREAEQMSMYRTETREPSIMDRITSVTPRQVAWGAIGSLTAFFTGRVAKRRFIRRQDGLVVSYGVEMATIAKQMKGRSMLAELRGCHREYCTRLGPGQRRKEIFIAFLSETVKSSSFSVEQVQAVRLVMDLLKVKEEVIAKWFVDAAKRFKRKTGSAARVTVLLLAERTLNSQDALYEVEQIRDLAGGGTAEGNELVDVQLGAIREKAYRDIIFRTPEKRRLNGPPPGGDVLGLTPEQVGSIYADVMEDTTPDYLKYAPKKPEVSEFEEQEKRKAKLLAVDNLTLDDVRTEEEEKQKAGGSGSGGASGAKTYECSKCGYTLFVAQGREEKFFPAGFTCPSCGAAREDFKEK